MTLQVPVINNQGVTSFIDVAVGVFDQIFNETLVHQLVIKYLADARSGTKAQKNRASVSGGGIKPWRQKVTGRARAGTTRSPIWRTGGVTFAAQPRNYDQKINKKMYKIGVRSIFSELLRQGRLEVNDNIVLATAKTKELNEKLKSIEGKRILIVVDSLDVNLLLASRNIPYLEVATAGNVNPVSLVSANKVVVTTGALRQIEEQLA
jgi:large subunit ribosomal protein L4